jgi:hypothetical protein
LSTLQLSTVQWSTVQKSSKEKHITVQLIQHKTKFSTILDRRVLKGKFPYVGVIMEESDRHREPTFKAEMLAKFGRQTGIDPSVAWPSKEQVLLAFFCTFLPLSLYLSIYISIYLLSLSLSLFLSLSLSLSLLLINCNIYLRVIFILSLALSSLSVPISLSFVSKSFLALSISLPFSLYLISLFSLFLSLSLLSSFLSRYLFVSKPFSLGLISSSICQIIIF